MRRVRLTVLATILTLTASMGALVTGTGSAVASDPLRVPYQFLPTAVIGGASVNAPGTNNWKCKPSARHPRPVVLVHGTAGNKSTNWQTYGPLLKNHGYCVFALTYGVPATAPPVADQLAGMNGIRSSARELRTFVTKVRRATGAAKVDLIGHSQGTLMPQYYVKFLGGRRYVSRYISLAPLWNGTGLGRNQLTVLLSTVFGTSTLPYCVACSQMGTGSAFMKEVRKGGLVVPGIRYVNIMTKYDQLVVPYTSGIVPGMRNIVLQNRCAQDFSEHFQIAANPNAARLVLNHLDPARAKPLVCRLQVPFVGGP